MKKVIGQMVKSGKRLTKKVGAFLRAFFACAFGGGFLCVGWSFCGRVFDGGKFAGEGGDDGKYVCRPTQNLRQKIGLSKISNLSLDNLLSLYYIINELLDEPCARRVVWFRR
jgi:hypothetical protein